MLLNYFRFAIRNLRRHTTFSFVNITGLAIGMMLCIAIVQYAIYQKSFDEFHVNKNEIVRVTYSRYLNNEFQFTRAMVFPAVGEAAKQNVAGVQDFTRMFPVTNHAEAVFSVDNKTTVETSVYAVDPAFLSMFSLPLISGDQTTALTSPNSMMLSKSAAARYFGDDDPVNKVIHWDGFGDFTVTGIFDDLPSNTHMHFDVLVSWIQMYGDRSLWNWDSFYTYLQLTPGADLAKVEGDLQAITNEKIKASNPMPITAAIHLQPLTDIHLRSHLTGEMKVNGDETIVDALIVIAAFILIIACINYTNLSLARTLRRMKETGIRKVIGSTSGQIRAQFFIESLTLNIIAFVIACLLCIVLWLPFESLVGERIDSVLVREPWIAFAAFAIVVLITSLLSGIYPAQMLSRYNPAESLKGSNILSGSQWLRKGLITFQFSVTLILITGTIVIYRQVSFMQGQKLGFTLDQNLSIKTFATPQDTTFESKISAFIATVRDHTHVNNATVTSNIPGRENDWVGRLRISEASDEMITSARTRVDENFIDTYGLQLLAGANFSSTSVPNQVIINEAAVKALGFQSNKEAVGAKLMQVFTIIGVVNNYHERSLHETVMPAIYTRGQGYMKYVTVNISPGNARETVDFLQRKWKLSFPGKPFEYVFLDEFFNRQYDGDRRLANVFFVFSMAGIIIACLGLLGFTYFIVHQRRKEIGIRKVLGATAVNISRLLVLEFGWMLLIAAMFALPFAWYLSDDWLQRFAFRDNIPTYIFGVPVVLLAVVLTVTIGVQIIKAVKTNVSDSLRSE
jgi:putative ABC transport system permease protein